MLQAAFLDCQFLDLCPFSDDGFVAPKIDVSWRDVVQALVVAFVVVVIDEGPDLAFEIAGQIVVFQQNPVLHGLMPTLDLALGLRPLGDASITCQVTGGTALHERDPSCDLPTIRPNRQRCNTTRCH